MTQSLRAVLLVLGLLVGLCYFSSLNGDFHFDDSHSIVNNLTIRSLKNLPLFWTDPSTSSFIPENRNYRPLVYCLYTVCWALGGGRTWPFHVEKIGFHWMVCVALYLIWYLLFTNEGWFPSRTMGFKLPFLRRTIVWNPSSSSFLLASLFAIHPACSECVDYISATTSLQAAVFYVWAYYCYLLFRGNKNRKILYISLFLYFCAVASKEEGITLPAMVFVTEMFLSRGGAKDRIRLALREMLPYGILGILLSIWLYWMHPVEGNISRGLNTPFEYFITQWRSYLWYMRLWFWPWDLNADSASIVFSKTLFDPLVIQSGVGNLVLLGLAWRLRRRFPAILFGLAWFYVTISPASSIVVLAEAVNEHRMYLAYIGFVGGAFIFFLAFTEELQLFAPKSRWLGGLLCAIYIGLFVGTQERNRVWANDENLWKDTVEKNPTSGRALNNLALVYLQRGEYRSSVEYLKKCEVSWSSYMYCPLNLGIAYTGLGVEANMAGKADEAKLQFLEAEKSFERAYSLNPNSVHTNFYLGKYYEENNADCSQAVKFYLRAIELTQGRYPAADVRLAICYKKMNRLSDAQTALDRALSVEPSLELALFEKGKMEIEVGHFLSAIDIYEKFNKLYPEQPQGLYNLGLAYERNANFAAAKRSFEKLILLDSKSLQGWLHLALAAEKTGDSAVASRASKELFKLSSGNPVFQKKLKEFKKKFGENNL